MKGVKLKKLISYVLAMGLLITSVPISTYAAEESDSQEEDVIVLPMRLIDYRADNLLFEYLFDTNGSKMALTDAEIADISEDVTVTEVAPVDPTVEGAASAYFTTGLVESTLSKDGYPVYTEKTISYVAKKVQDILEQELSDERDDVYPFYTQLREQIKKEDSFYNSGNFVWADWEPEELVTETVESNWKLVGGDLTFTSTGTGDVMRSKALTINKSAIKYTLTLWVLGDCEIFLYGYSDEAGTADQYELAHEVVTQGGDQTVSFELDDLEDLDIDINTFRIQISCSAIEPAEGSSYTTLLGNDMKLTYTIIQSVSEGDPGSETTETVFDAQATHYDQIGTTKVGGWTWLVDSNSDGENDDLDLFPKKWVDEVEEKISWNEPGADGNIASNDGGDLTSEIITGLTPNKEYEFQIWYTDGAMTYKVEALNEDETVAATFTGSFPDHSDVGWKEETISIGTIPTDRVRITFTATADNPIILGIDAKLVETGGSSYPLGSYAASAAKEFTSETDITTCFDYAYYMMNHYFDKNNVMGRPYDIYKQLVLTPNDDENGYSFYANFDLNHGFEAGSTATQWLPIVYDLESGSIRNSTDETAYTEKGFYPLSERNTVDSNGTLLVDTTGDWLQVSNKYVGNGVTENYHYAMESSGKFVYESDKNQFFDFTGDDDVYLYINGQLVLDIGGAHYAVNQRVNVNDVAEKLGLEDGHIYNFDFFYLERHSDYANLRVNTNIRLLYDDASIQKQAYVDGTEQAIPSGSAVAPGTQVDYAFTIRNTGTLPIHNLHITDEMLGIDISKDECIINNKEITEDDVLDLKIHVKWHSSSTDQDEDQVWPVTKLSELKGLLSAANSGPEFGGYATGAVITISGFKYTVPSDEESDEYKKALENGILNIVALKYDAYEDGNEGNEDSLETHDGGSARHMMNVAVGDEYYVWANGETVELDGLLDNTIVYKEGETERTWANEKDNLTVTFESSNAISKITYSDGKVYYTSQDGIAGNWSIDDSITVKLTGKITVQVEGEDGNTTDQEIDIDLSIPVTVHLYDTKDDIYVLDYGLPVDLADTTYGNGMFQNDLLYNANAETNAELMTLDDTGLTQGTVTEPEKGKLYQYGDENDALTSGAGLVEGQVTYSPTAFMDQVEKIGYKAAVYTGDELPAAFKASIGASVEGTVQVMPASVVYYEDNFADEITYTGAEGKIVNNTTNITLVQSNNQDEQYGHDDAYRNDGSVTDSANGSTQLIADGYTTTASFTFKGTGFDIVGRSNTTSSGIAYLVTDSEGNDKVLGVVDTYYANGDLYQIPVIHVDLDDYDTYTVTLGIFGKDTTFYLDGVRIYNPLGTAGNENYISGENGAEIVKVGDLILGDGEITEKGVVVNGENTVTEATIPGAKAALVGCDEEEGLSTLGMTKTEDINGGNGDSTKTDSILQYLHSGPNNEIYLGDFAAIAFVATETSETNRTLQIEAKLVNIDGMAEEEVAEDEADLRIWTEEGYETIETIKTATAMYYKIDLSKCISLENGKYLVVICGNTGNETHVLSFSNLKVKGYEISNALSDEDAKEYITTSATNTSKFESFGTTYTKITRKEKLTNKYAVVFNEDVFGDESPVFKLYYTNNGEKTEISVTATQDKTDTSGLTYKLTFKAPNAVGDFPLELHYVVNGEESSDYIMGTLKVIK